MFEGLEGPLIGSPFAGSDSEGGPIELPSGILFILFQAGLINIIILLIFFFNIYLLLFSQPLSSGVAGAPHISVGGLDPLFGGRPRAQQSRGCGAPGDLISVGADLIKWVGNKYYIII